MVLGCVLPAENWIRNFLPYSFCFFPLYVKMCLFLYKALFNSMETKWMKKTLDYVNGWAQGE
jgi:hypothetical protein